MTEPLRRSSRPRAVRRTINAASAAEAVGPITHGCEIYGLSKGQFSLIDLIEHVLDATGPAHLTVSTWTAAGADLAHCHQLLGDGRVLTARWLVDFSFPARQPTYCQQLRDRFGDAAIACTANHAKFVLVRNAEWAVVVRTSMNLNWNRRLESYEISDDQQMADWLEEVVAATFDGGATIGAAVGHPANARDRLSTIMGNVEHRSESTLITHDGDGHGIGFD